MVNRFFFKKRCHLEFIITLVNLTFSSDQQNRDTQLLTQLITQNLGTYKGILDHS